MADSNSTPRSGNAPDAEHDAAHTEAQRPAPRRRSSRRAQRPAPAGSDPTPFDPPVTPRSAHENDARLTQDKPPHWG